MREMFQGCSSLASVDLSNFNTEKTYGLYGMFKNCSSLTSLDLSSFNTASFTYLSSMFENCSNLVTITVADDWDVTHVNSDSYYSRDMFYHCYNLVGGQGTKYNSSHTDKTYARIDGGTDNPGYLSAVVILGDVDGNGSVGIADVTALIDYILGGDGTGLNLAAADVNGDGTVGIADVTTIVDMILVEDTE